MNPYWYAEVNVNQQRLLSITGPLPVVMQALASTLEKIPEIHPYDNAKIELRIG